MVENIFENDELNTILKFETSNQMKYRILSEIKMNEDKICKHLFKQNNTE